MFCFALRKQVWELTSLLAACLCDSKTSQALMHAGGCGDVLVSFHSYSLTIHSTNQIHDAAGHPGPVAMGSVVLLRSPRDAPTGKMGLQQMHGRAFGMQSTTSWLW